MILLDRYVPEQLAHCDACNKMATGLWKPEGEKQIKFCDGCFWARADRNRGIRPPEMRP